MKQPRINIFIYLITAHELNWLIMIHKQNKQRRESTTNKDSKSTNELHQTTTNYCSTIGHNNFCCNIRHLPCTLHVCKFKNIPAGVPLGSFLGLNLFILYLNDVAQTHTHLAVYATFTTIYSTSSLVISVVLF